MAKLASRRIGSLALVLFTALCTWLPAGLTARQSKPPEAIPAGIEVKIQAQPLRATVGDPIQIDLDFAFPRSYRFEFPSLTGQIGEFAVLETFPGPDLPPRQPAGGTPAAGQKSNEFHHFARIVVAVYRTGEFEFPALPFMIRDAAGKELQVMSPVVKIRIDSVLQEADPKLKDLKKQAEIEEPSRWLLWLVLGGLACALGLLVWWWIMRRRRPTIAPAMQPEMDPLDAAEAELRDLLARGLLEKGLTKQFYVYLSDIVKRALEAGYGIQTVEKTTTEIMGALAGAAEGNASPSDSEDLKRIELLLLACDMVKFARYLPSRAENDEAIKGSLQVLLGCRSRRQPIDADAAPVDGVR